MSLLHGCGCASIAAHGIPRCALHVPMRPSLLPLPRPSSRVMLKVSGEALEGSQGFGIDPNVLQVGRGRRGGALLQPYMLCCSRTSPPGGNMAAPPRVMCRQHMPPAQLQARLLTQAPPAPCSPHCRKLPARWRRRPARECRLPSLWAAASESRITRSLVPHVACCIKGGRAQARPPRAHAAAGTCARCRCASLVHPPAHARAPLPRSFFRGVDRWAGLDRATADYVGMLATVMNAICLQASGRRQLW